MSDSLRLSTFIPASPGVVYNAWLDADRHSSMTGSRAASQPRVGGSFTAWDGYISGEHLELISNERIVQSWRTTDFAALTPDSLLEVELEPEGTGTRLTLIHTDLPEGEAERYEQGWRQFYFEPMQRYFTRLEAASAVAAPPRRRRIVVSTATAEALRMAIAPPPNTETESLESRQRVIRPTRPEPSKTELESADTAGATKAAQNATEEDHSGDVDDLPPRAAPGSRRQAKPAKAGRKQVLATATTEGKAPIKKGALAEANPRGEVKATAQRQPVSKALPVSKAKAAAKKPTGKVQAASQAKKAAVAKKLAAKAQPSSKAKAAVVKRAAAKAQPSSKAKAVVAKKGASRARPSVARKAPAKVKPVAAKQRARLRSSVTKKPAVKAMPIANKKRATQKPPPRKQGGRPPATTARGRTSPVSRPGMDRKPSRTQPKATPSSTSGRRPAHAKAKRPGRRRR